jgi:transcriptional adapter 2-alpha
VQCFANGDTSHKHDPVEHPFRVIEQNSVPIYEDGWGADEELLLLEGAEVYGLGSWADIADHIGGYREKDEVRQHYENVYLASPNFPLPKRASPHDMELQEKLPREEFQMRKKRRIEERKEATKNASPQQPKTKPTASVPACHEVQGYMPGRLEFETEYANEAEEAVQHMQFEPGDGINPQTGLMEPEMELKMTVMDIYNSKLTARAERKKVIFEHNLLEYKSISQKEKRRTKEERDLLNKAKPLARIMNKDDFEAYSGDLIAELNLRQAVAQLQDWRQVKIGDLKSGEKYEQDKISRAQKQAPMGSLDRERYATSQRNKAAIVPEVPSATAELLKESYLSPSVKKLAFRGMIGANGVNGTSETNGTNTPTVTEKSNGLLNGLTNGHTNGDSTPTPTSSKQKHIIQPLSGVAALQMTAADTTDLHLLTKEEQELCRTLRIQPKPYLVIKEQIMKEALKGNGTLKKKQAKEICRLDTQKGGRIFDFFLMSGWIGKA